MYGVKASESSTTSSSLGPGSAAPGLMTGKDDARGPTGLMLRNFYRALLILTGDIGAGNIGPYPDKGSNDIGLLNDFASGIGGLGKPRFVWVMGRTFMEGQMGAGTNSHPTWPPAYFGAGLANGIYRSYANNTTDIVDLIPNAPVFLDGSRYGVLSNCTINNDVLTLQGTFGAAVSAKYPDTPTNPNPKIASVYAPSTFPGSADHEAVTLVEGFRIQSLGTMETLTSNGTIRYFKNTFANLANSFGCTVVDPNFVSVGEDPNNALIHYLALRSENPHRGGDAEIRFGITRKERVELKVYDVTGRLVKTLANREFAAGEHNLFWDGSNEDGQLVPRGVYFYQLRTPSFVSQKKLAVLKH
jgi:hypothetical protein